MLFEGLNSCCRLINYEPYEKENYALLYIFIKF